MEISGNYAKHRCWFEAYNHRRLLFRGVSNLWRNKASLAKQASRSHNFKLSIYVAPHIYSIEPFRFPLSGIHGSATFKEPQKRRNEHKNVHSRSTDSNNEGITIFGILRYYVSERTKQRMLRMSTETLLVVDTEKESFDDEWLCIGREFAAGTHFSRKTFFKWISGRRKS